MKIRRAQEKDIPKILDLLIQVNLVHHLGRPDIFKQATKYTAQDLRGILADPQRPIFVAADDADEVLGYGFCECQQHVGDQMLTDIRTLYIDDICVDEAARGQHVGTAIFGAIKEYAKQEGFYNITLNVWELNPTARRFYESLGMIPLKTMMETIISD